MDSTVKEGRFQIGEIGQARRASLGEVEGSTSGTEKRRNSPGRSAESWFHSKSGQT